MIKIENLKAFGISEALGGNNLSYSRDAMPEDEEAKLLCKLTALGPSHAKPLRQMFVSMKITAPMYWWKEMDTYKVSTVRNSSSTMHTICKKPFEMSDFSYDNSTETTREYIRYMVTQLNSMRDIYLNGMTDEDGTVLFPPKSKDIWRSIIQMLPSSYNQTAVWTGNYEVLSAIIEWRTGHKLIEWAEFIEEMKKLPKSRLIFERATKKWEKEHILRAYMKLGSVETFRKLKDKHRETLLEEVSANEDNEQQVYEQAELTEAEK